MAEPTVNGTIGRAGRANDRELSRVAATHRGVHDRLAVLDPDRPHSFNPRRTLRFRVEFVRQVKRRRTHVAFGLLLILPILVALAFQLGGAEEATNGTPQLVGLATAGATNFALFTLFAAVGFLLIVVVSLFAGDTVSSEASWSSLRYLLAQPVPRARLLRQKLAVAGVLCVAATLLLPVWSYLVGGVFFGFGPAVSPLGGTIGDDGGSTFTTMLVIVGYVSVQLLGIAAMAFFFSTLVDNPLGAVGGAVMFTVISTILDEITALGIVRQWLLAHWDYAWTAALSSPTNYDDMIRGTGVALVYVAVFLGLAFLRFDRKDITS